MKCPFCNSSNLKVLDKRDNEDNIRRRRECLDCQKRFTTYERIELSPLIVIKKDATRRSFDVNKVKAGLFKACEKRPISVEDIDFMASMVEKSLRDLGKSEINSREIGEEIMQVLKERDKIAYIRFASVYREFADLNDFKDELLKLK